MTKLTPPLGPSDHDLGYPGALVTLTEYGDYECPFCGRAHQVVKLAMAKLGRTMRFAFRNFPLPQTHPHALAAALAAEAANTQGKFWPMHDLLFEHQGALEKDDLVGYARRLELDVDRFSAELSSQRHLDKIQTDIRSGMRSGVSGTPTFFIEGVRYEAPWDPGTLIATLSRIAATKPRLDDTLKAPR